LLPHFHRVIFTQYQNNPRAVPPEELAASARRCCEKPFEICPDPAAAWSRVETLAGEEDLVCITGSFFIASEIRALLAVRPLRPSPSAVLESA
jgi:dihydrofolate synthase/folylpolyglutamate synthase